LTTAASRISLSSSCRKVFHAERGHAFRACDSPRHASRIRGRARRALAHRSAIKVSGRKREVVGVLAPPAIDPSRSRRTPSYSWEFTEPSERDAAAGREAQGVQHRSGRHPAICRQLAGPSGTARESKN
jgi:hypothetical protein